MKSFFLLLVVFTCFANRCFSQQPITDSTDNARLANMLNLSEVVVRSGMDVQRFIKQVKEDTTFYKAFRTLHVLGFTSWNDVRIKNKKGKVVASLLSKTRQNRAGNCRTMDILEQNVAGNFFDSEGKHNYETGELYEAIFFTKGKVCGENNIVKGVDFRPKSQKGMSKHKEQLKMLFFNPGKKIPGIPFIGDKIDIFNPDKARNYDFEVDFAEYSGEHCFVFSIKAKADPPDGRGSIVIDSMITWFSTKTMEVLARNYDMSYSAGVYDFDVHMEVQMTRFGQYLVPKVLRYIGNWDVITKKRERGLFTATLFDFRE